MKTPLTLLMPALAATMLISSTGLAQSPDAGEPVQVAQPAEETDPGSGEAPPSPEEAAGAPDEAIEEIVITGQVRESVDETQDGADSVEEFKAADLEAMGAQDLADIANFTPNLEIVTYGTTPTFFIRGVGLNDFNANSTSAVAVYQDNVHVNSPALQLGVLFDVKAVNVLRGPQGWGIARNASAGAIKVYSQQPSGQFGGFLRSDFGNFNSMQFEGAVEAPIVADILSTRLAFMFTDRDGYMKNRCAGAPPVDKRVPYDDPSRSATDPPWSHCSESVGLLEISTIPTGLKKWVNDEGRWGARASFLFEPTLDMSWLLIGRGSRRNEYSQLGQAYGTDGFFCLDGDIANCYGPNPEFPEGSRIQNTLGGRDVEGYQAPEVRERLAEFAPCAAANPSDCGAADYAAENDGKLAVAKELAAKLDSEPFEGDFNRTGKTKNDTWGISLQGDFELPHGMALTSVTGYDAYDRFQDIDLDFSPNESIEIETKDDLWQVYQDLNLGGELDLLSGGFWNVGGYALFETLDVTVNNFFGQATSLTTAFRAYEQTLSSGALYGDLSVDFWDDFTLDGGIRWNIDHKGIDYQLVKASQLIEVQREDTWHAPTGGVRLTYRFSDETLVYWKYMRGWKGGHYNATSSDFQNVSVADPETNNAFEVGMRGTYLDGMLGVTASFFYYDYNNYQVFTAQQTIEGQPEFVILNANDAEVYGAEIDVLAKPWEGAFWNVRLGWLETQFLDFVQIQQQLVTGGNVINREIQNSGNPLLNSPRLKVAFTLSQVIWMGRFGSLIPRYDGAWTDVTYFDGTAGRGIPNAQGVQFYPENSIGQQAFWLHNLRLTYRLPSETVEIALWVRNLTDQVYKTFAFDGSTFNKTSLYFVGEPRMFGGSFRVSF